MKVTQKYFISNSLKMTANKFLKLYQGVVANAMIDQHVVDMNRILHDLCREGMVVKRENVAPLGLDE
jgi:hypothetical protein